MATSCQVTLAVAGRHRCGCPFEDDEPDRVAVGEGHRHPQDALIEGQRLGDVADGHGAGDAPEGNAGSGIADYRAP
jgi:hypothetical protein